MQMPFTPLVSGLPAQNPFEGPRTKERRRGRAYQARLGANENLFGVSSRVAAAAAEAAAELPLYTDPAHYDLRSEIARRLGRPVEEVSVGEGIDGLLGWLVRVFVAPGDVAVTSSGAYPTFDYHVEGYGGRLVRVPYRDDWHNDLDGLVAAAARHRAKVLYLANPDNPTGTLLPAEVIADALERLPERCILLLDEAYAEFAPSHQLLDWSWRDPRLVRLRTFSKAYGLAGARVGYALVNSQITRTLERVRLHFGVGRMAQQLALVALRDQAFIDEIIAKTDEAKDHFAGIAARAGVQVIPSYTNFVAFDIGDRHSAADMATWLEENDVFVRRPGEPPLDRLIRVTASHAEDRAYFESIFLEGASRLLKHQSVKKS